MTAKMVCRCTDLIEFFWRERVSVLLAATIKTHIGKYMEKYPDTARTLDHCFYVDDLVTGEDDAKSAFDLSSKAAKIMSEAGMNLRKWISNDCELMKQWQLEHFDHLNMNDFVNHPHRVLGLLWHPQKTISVFV
ncbi:integrase catalytic domain-containing protein [Trichonephila clavipes]|nr:integrase catalytic domain-containing protein [Trichonephila clavipes]